MASDQMVKKIKNSYRRVQDLQFFPVLLGPKTHELVIATGADSSYYKSLCQFLSSLFKHEPNIKAVVFDLGLTKTELQYISGYVSKRRTKMF